MEKKTRRKIGLVMLALTLIVIVAFCIIGPDRAWDTLIGRITIAALILLWAMSIVLQIIDAFVYFLKNK